jgi:hypothetical protein
MGFVWKTVGVRWAFSFGAIMALIAALLAILLLGGQDKTVSIESKTA